MIRSFRDDPGLQAPPVISRLISAAEKKITNFMRTHAAHLAPQKSTPSRSPSIMMRRHLKPHIIQQDPVIVYPRWRRDSVSLGNILSGVAFSVSSAQWWDRWHPLAARQEHYSEKIGNAIVCFPCVHEQFGIWLYNTKIQWKHIHT